MITLLRSIVFSLIFYPGSLLLVLIALVVGQFSPPALRWVATMWGWFHRHCARWLLGQRVVIEGDLPLGSYLYVVKHESMFETIDMLCVFDLPVIPAKRELFDIPLWGIIAERYGLIPIERAAGASAMRTLRTRAREANEAGRAVCIFPEGTRVPHGQSPPLQSGFAGLYALLGLPVVPIALDSGRVSPKGSFLKKAGIITYKVGAIVPAGLDRRVAEVQVHAAINALNPPSALT